MAPSPEFGWLLTLLQPGLTGLAQAMINRLGGVPNPRFPLCLANQGLVRVNRSGLKPPVTV